MQQQFDRAKMVGRGRGIAAHATRVGLAVFLLSYLLSAVAGDCFATVQEVSTSDPTFWTQFGNAELGGADGHLAMAFPEQDKPELQTGTALAKMNPGCYVTNVTFRFKADQCIPSSLRLCLSTSGKGGLWFLNLPAPKQVGAWHVYQIGIGVAGQRWGNLNMVPVQQLFADLLALDSVGVYVRRHGDTREQVYHLADVVVSGMTFQPQFSVSGQVAVQDEAWAGRPVYVEAIAISGTATGACVAVQPDGRFSYAGLDLSTAWKLRAYADVNGNGGHDFDEPACEWLAAAEQALVSNDIGGIVLTLRAPCDGRGVSYKWLREYLGLTGYVGNDPESIAKHALRVAADDDGDGCSNYQEYVAGTHPGNRRSRFQVSALPREEQPADGFAIAWPAQAGRSYQILKRTFGAREFVPVGDPITTTGDKAVYVDRSGAPGIYRVAVKQG